MIVASHAVNAALPLLDSVVPTVAGVDLAATVERVAGWGGNPALYTHFLARGLAASGSVDATEARRLGVLAGWRSGVVGLRSEALNAATQGQPTATASALGLDEAALDAFVASQGLDRFAHPQQGVLVATIGGFRGFGGPWLAPPSSVRFVGDGQLDVQCADELWRVTTDVFGARLERVTEAAAAVPPHGVRADVSDDSYLVTLTRTTAP